MPNAVNIDPPSPVVQSVGVLIGSPSSIVGKLPLSAVKMGWKSDWLYQLIFDQFERAWSQAQADGESRFGPASTSLLVGEYDKAVGDGSPPYCRGNVVRAWNFAGREWNSEAAAELLRHNGSTHGMFYHTAMGGFCISADRKTVMIEYRFGPRYGRGFVFIVQGQGDTARLLPKPDSVIWHS